MSKLEFLGRIPLKVIWFIVLLAIFIPSLYPLGLPIAVSPMTKDFNEWIFNVPQDQVVVYIDGCTQALYYPLKGGIVVPLKILMERNAKIIIFSIAPDGPVKLNDLRLSLEFERYGYVYGKDYVFFGYLAGVEMAMASFAADISSAYSQDYYGNPTESLPLMQRVHNWEDVDIAMILSIDCMAPDQFVRQWAVGKQNPIDDIYGDGVTTIALASTQCAPVYVPYYGVKPGFNKMLYGLQGFAEFEIVSNRPGISVGIADAKNIVITVFTLFVVMGNIAYFSERKDKNKEKKP